MTQTGFTHVFKITVRFVNKGHYIFVLEKVDFITFKMLYRFKRVSHSAVISQKAKL